MMNKEDCCEKEDVQCCWVYIGEDFLEMYADIFEDIHGDTRQDTSAMKQGLKCK